MSGGVLSEIRFKWSFGKQATAEGGSIIGSTGEGARLNTMGLGREHTFYIETDGDCTCSYQICTARTFTGARVSISSGTLATGAIDIVQIVGPFSYAFPRIKTMTSTSVNVHVELMGN